MSELASNQARFTLAIDGVSSAFQVVRWEGREALSALYAVRVEALADDHPAPHELLGRAALLTVLGAEGPRHVHGIVASATDGRVGLRQRGVEVVIAPRASRLAFSIDTRIFQQKTLRDIVAEVLREHGVDGAKLRFELQNPHDPHDYCVQYRESDWAFVSRLCEAEGVFCFFEHSESDHVMVFADHPRAHPLVEGDAHVPIRDPSGQVESAAFVSVLRETARIGVGKVHLQDYFFVQPALDLGSDASGDAGPELEFYDHPAGHESVGVGRRVAKLRLEELAWQQLVADGRSNVARLCPGHRFTLVDDDGLLRDEMRREYVVVAVTHHGEQPSAQADGARAGVVEYVNDFEAIPSSVAYRAPRSTPRPRVSGVQTAIVVGPAGEEIYTDEHGRVKVHFHWDRLGKRNERSSCWIRVSQAWAGQGYGFMAVPRVGHEVVVSFVEGDPDRPLVTGRVYHGTNTVPYDLPGNKTRTTLKSNSSPGGGGSNELRFEDSAGFEEVYLHAQKDWNIVVEHDKSQRVGRDESLDVGRDRSTSVGRDESVTVGHDETISVGNDHTESIGANATITVGAHHVESIGASRQESVAQDATLDVGGNRTTEVCGDESLSVLKGSSESVGKAKSVDVAQGYSINVGAAFALTAKGNLSEETDADLTLTAKKKVVVASKEDTTLGAEKKMSLSAKDDLAVKTDKGMSLTAADQVVITCGSATVTLKKNGDIVVKGGKVTVEGSGDVVIKGSTVSMN